MSAWTRGVCATTWTCLLASSLVAPRPVQDHAKSADPAKAERIDIPGVENAFRLTPRLYSGGDPRGAAAFEALRDLGVRTIISVDGAQPDVEAARAVGIRYVHLPIGYDAVPPDQAAKLALAMKTLPGPVYIHCHHGKHRGPAAAAVCAIAAEGWSNAAAVEWMKQAGTAADYRGLFESALTFAPPSADELSRADASLPERAEVPAIVDLMLQVDTRWEHLDAIRQAGYATPPDQADLDPPHEALQLAELYQELQRLPETKLRGETFEQHAAAAAGGASALQRALQALAEDPTNDRRVEVEAAFAAARRACTQCHAQFRDNAGG